MSERARRAVGGTGASSSWRKVVRVLGADSGGAESEEPEFPAPVLLGLGFGLALGGGGERLVAVRQGGEGRVVRGAQTLHQRLQLVFLLLEVQLHTATHTHTHTHTHTCPGAIHALYTLHTVTKQHERKHLKIKKPWPVGTQWRPARDLRRRDHVTSHSSAAFKELSIKRHSRLFNSYICPQPFKVHGMVTVYGAS